MPPIAKTSWMHGTDCMQTKTRTIKAISIGIANISDECREIY